MHGNRTRMPRREKRSKYSLPTEQVARRGKKSKHGPLIRSEDDDDHMGEVEQYSFNSAYSGAMPKVLITVGLMLLAGFFVGPMLMDSKALSPLRQVDTDRSPPPPPPDEYVEVNFDDFFPPSPAHKEKQSAGKEAVSVGHEEAPESIRPHPPPPPRRGLTAAQCTAFFNDPTHIFRRMWASDAWAMMANKEKSAGSTPCWEVSRELDSTLGSPASQPPEKFFKDVLDGAYCDSNWYEGNLGELGKQHSRPEFRKEVAPALLGFDENIDNFCALELGGWEGHAKDLGHAQRCVEASHNILSLYGERVPYNICRNLEWMVCSAKGLLPGQGGKKIRFSKAPYTLQPDGLSGKPLGKCCGWVPEDMQPIGGSFGYATDDIYYLEACIFSQICRNSDELFTLGVGDPFICDFSEDKFASLQQTLLSPWDEPSTATKCSKSRTCIEVEPGEKPTCPMCWRINGGNGDCSSLQGCNNKLCGFCTNE